MPEYSGNFNIFNGRAESLQTALQAMTASKTLALPVTGEQRGTLQLYTIISRQEGGRALLQAFTDSTTLTTQFIQFTPLETAQIFFHATAYDAFIFYPDQARGSSVIASRANISLLIGSLQVGSIPGPDILKKAAVEFSAGNPHKSHFLYSLAARTEPAACVLFPFCATLVELGLYREARDILSTESTPQAALLLATIYRKTGDLRRAAETLNAIASTAPLQENKALETAWLYLETDREAEAEKEFRRIGDTGHNKAEAFKGLGAAIAKRADRTKDPGLLAPAASALESALKLSLPGTAGVFFQLGNIYYKSGCFAQAELCYRRAATISPGEHILTNLAATLTRTGKSAEAKVLAARIALTNPQTAAQLADALQSDSMPLPGNNPPCAEPAAAGLPAAKVSASEFTLEAFPPAPQPPSKAPSPASSSGQASLSPAELRSIPQSFTSGEAPASELEIEFFSVTPPSPAKVPPPAPVTRQASLEPAPCNTPQAFSSGAPDSPHPDMAIKREARASGPSSATKPGLPDNFMSGAFRLASALERESGSKVRFNREGLDVLEAKLRSTFKVAKSETLAELVTDCAAFICYFLQERHKGQLIRLPGIAPWAWPMLFEHHGLRLTTYPAERVWRLTLGEKVPEPGWLGKYTDWLIAALQVPHMPSGELAVKLKAESHPERLTDTRTEHRRVLTLAANIPEISDIKTEASGLIKLTNALKNNFHPDIPPSADGWRLLRCYGHILAEILAKDFTASWYNTDGEDGGWSMRLPWGTFVFPLGKIYKAAATGQNIGDFYAALLSEKNT